MTGPVPESFPGGLPPSLPPVVASGSVRGGSTVVRARAGRRAPGWADASARRRTRGAAPLVAGAPGARGGGASAARPASPAVGGRRRAATPEERRDKKRASVLPSFSYHICPLTPKCHCHRASGAHAVKRRVSRRALRRGERIPRVRATYAEIDPACASLRSSCSCSSRHRILPDPAFGKESTNSTLRGTLYAAMRD